MKTLVLPPKKLVIYSTRSEIKVAVAEKLFNYQYTHNTKKIVEKFIHMTDHF